jgi:hypothetical protein
MEANNMIYPFKVNEEAKISLVIGERASQIESKAVRVWEPENEKAKKSPEFVSIQFQDMKSHIKMNWAERFGISNATFVTKRSSTNLHKFISKRSMSVSGLFHVKQASVTRFVDASDSNRQIHRGNAQYIADFVCGLIAKVSLAENVGIRLQERKVAL